MNDSKNSSNGLLVLRYPMALPIETIDKLIEQITPIADELGLEPMVLDGGADIRIENGRDALLERVCVALEEIAQQGRAPEISEAQEALQKPSLNHRPEHPADRSGQIGGLNSREVLCKGAPELGTACGECSRCKAFGWHKSRG